MSKTEVTPASDSKSLGVQWIRGQWQGEHQGTGGAGCCYGTIRVWRTQEVRFKNEAVMLGVILNSLDQVGKRDCRTFKERQADLEGEMVMCGT